MQAQRGNTLQNPNKGLRYIIEKEEETKEKTKNDPLIETEGGGKLGKKERLWVCTVKVAGKFGRRRKKCCR